MKKILIEKSTYLDSVSLMRISKKATQAEGVKSAMVAMATDTNLLLLREAGFDPGGALGATSNDLIIALDAADDASFEGALAMIRLEIEGGIAPVEGAEYRPRSLDAAVKLRPNQSCVHFSAGEVCRRRSPPGSHGW